MRHGRRGRTAGNREELIDADDKVVAFVRTSGKGKGSGVQVEAHVGNVWTFRDGKPVEWKYFGEDRTAALEAAGLKKPDEVTVIAATTMGAAGFEPATSRV